MGHRTFRGVFLLQQKPADFAREIFKFSRSHFVNFCKFYSLRLKVLLKNAVIHGKEKGNFKGVIMSNSVDSKIYQFIAKNGGLEKVDANGNGNISLGELTNFLEGLDLSEFGNKSDLISEFFRDFDKNISTGTIAGTKDRNCGALDKDEQKALEAKIKKYSDFYSYLQTAVSGKCPSFLGNGTKAAWENAVSRALENLFNNSNCSDFSTLKSQWESNGTVDKIKNQTTAQYYQTNLSGSVVFKIQSLNLTNDEKKKVQTELESFLQKYTSQVNANTKLEDIQTEMDKIIETYLAKAGIQGHTADDDIAKKYGIASSDDMKLNELQTLVIQKNYSSVLTRFLSSDTDYQKYLELGGDASLINTDDFFKSYCSKLKNSNLANLSEESLINAFKANDEYKKIKKGIDAYEQAPAKIQAAIEADSVLKLAGYDKLKDTNAYTTAFKEAVKGYIQGSIGSIDAIAQKVVEALKGKTSELAKDGYFGGTDVGEFPTTEGLAGAYDTNVTIADGNLEQTIGAAKKFIQGLLDKKYTPYNQAIMAVFHCDANIASVHNALYKMKSADEVKAAMDQLKDKISYADYEAKMKEASNAKDTYNTDLTAAGQDKDKKIEAAMKYIATLINSGFHPFIEIILDIFGTLRLDKRWYQFGTSIEGRLKDNPALIDELIARIETTNKYMEVPNPSVTFNTTSYTAQQGKPVALDYTTKNAEGDNGKHKITFESSNDNVLVDANGKITVWDASKPTITTKITIYVDGRVLRTQEITINVISTEQVEAYGKASSATNKIKADALAYGQKEIHTEFGMDANGNIVFQESTTTQIYNKLCDEFIKQLRAAGVTESQISNADAKKMVQTAWIMSYNYFNSSQSNDTVNFLNSTLGNLRKILNKIKTNPEYLDIITGHTAYADSTLTTGLTHYGTNTTAGNDQIIIYKDGYNQTSDGAIHLGNAADDPDYQATMGDLLTRLINKYPNIDKSIITSVFREAQKKAIDICRNNTFDCPHGTANGSGGVLDTDKNWGGRDNRKKDKDKIYMSELVNLTLYCFDKLLYQKLFA